MEIAATKEALERQIRPTKGRQGVPNASCTTAGHTGSVSTTITQVAPASTVAKATSRTPKQTTERESTVVMLLVNRIKGRLHSG